MHVVSRLLGREGAAYNPSVPECTASGTGSGVALAAAAGWADVGFGIDHLVGSRVRCCTASARAVDALGALGSVMNLSCMT